MVDSVVNCCLLNSMTVAVMNIKHFWLPAYDLEPKPKYIKEKSY